MAQAGSRQKTVGVKAHEAFSKFFYGDVERARRALESGRRSEIDDAVGKLRGGGIRQLLEKAGGSRLRGLYAAASPDNTRKILRAATRGQVDEALGALDGQGVGKMLAAANARQVRKLIDSASNDARLGRILDCALDDPEGKLLDKVIDSSKFEQILVTVWAADPGQLLGIVASAGEKQLRKVMKKSGERNLNMLFTVSDTPRVRRMLDSTWDYDLLVDGLAPNNLGKALDVADDHETRRFLETTDGYAPQVGMPWLSEYSPDLRRAKKILGALNASNSPKVLGAASEQHLENLASVADAGQKEMMLKNAPTREKRREMIEAFRHSRR